MIDATALIVRLIPPGHAILLVGDELQAITDALDGRGCVCRTVRIEKLADLGQLATEKPAESIVIVDGFGRITDPVGALRSLSALVGPDGTLVVAADNAGYLPRRLDGLRGATPTTDDRGVPDRPYHLSTLRDCLAAAGLSVQDLLRVVRPLRQEDDTELHRLGLEDLANQPDASTTSFIAVTTRGEAGFRMGGTVAEYLQRELQEMAQQFTNQRRRADDLNDRVTQLASLVRTQDSDLILARGQIDELEAGMREREIALTERLRELGRKHAEQRHLRLDLVVKDDFVADLRAQLQTAEAERDRAEAEVARLLEEWDRPVYDAAEWIDLRLIRVWGLIARRHHRL